MDNQTYKMKIASLLLKDIMDVSHDTETGVTQIRTNEIKEAMMMVLAGLLSSDPQFTTPQGRKTGAKVVGQSFLDHVRQMQKAGGIAGVFAKDGIPFVLNDVNRRQ